MRIIASIVTAAMLLIHLLVGCCKHCASECQQCDVVAAVCASKTACCGHGDHSPSHGDQGSPAAPCKCKLECHSVCICLPPEKVTLDSSHADLPLEIVLAAPLWQSATLEVAALSTALPDVADVGPPVRLHLWHQILLI